MPEPERPAFDFDQFRAFGSVPRMLGSQVDVPRESSLDQRALMRVRPDILAQGLFGVSGKTAYNGLALGSDFYEAIVRSQGAFLTSVEGKTVSANALTPDTLAQERQLRSQLGSLSSKHDRHEKVIETLDHRKEVLATLIDMQRTPGYHRRVSDVDVRMMATTVWTEVFGGMLDVVKQQKDLSTDDMVRMRQAMAFRLLGGPQDERMANWGGMLRLGDRYTRSVSTMFNRSQGQIEKGQAKLEADLEKFYRDNGITPPLGKRAVDGTVEI